MDLVKSGTRLPWKFLIYSVHMKKMLPLVLCYHLLDGVSRATSQTFSTVSSPVCDKESMRPDSLDLLNECIFII